MAGIFPVEIDQAAFSGAPAPSGLSADEKHRDLESSVTNGAIRPSGSVGCCYCEVRVRRWWEFIFTCVCSFARFHTDNSVQPVYQFGVPCVFRLQVSSRQLTKPVLGKAVWDSAVLDGISALAPRLHATIQHRSAAEAQLAQRRHGQGRDHRAQFATYHDAERRIGQFLVDA